jgi:glycosyltransferase involved in cell wall biosynthesis
MRRPTNGIVARALGPIFSLSHTHRKPKSMGGPLVSLIVPTFERPRSLELVLRSIERQRELSDGDLEIVVADDGSQDATAEVVQLFRDRSRFKVLYTTHPHEGFQLARTRNDGVRASSAPYLVFLDGDCLAPVDHIAQYMKRRCRRTAMAGFCYYLDESTSARIDELAVDSGAFEQWATAEQRQQLTRMDRKARLYSLIRHPRRPKLYGGSFGMWRSDYEAVNGFNEEFTGWGCEDDEFGVRVRRAGIRVRSILRWTRAYHLWHPPVPSYPGHWRRGANVERLWLEETRTTVRCARGLQKPAA